MERHVEKSRGCNSGYHMVVKIVSVMWQDKNGCEGQGFESVMEEKVKFHGIFRDKVVEKSADFAGIFGGKLHQKAIGKKWPI